MSSKITGEHVISWDVDCDKLSKCKFKDKMISKPILLGKVEFYACLYPCGYNKKDECLLWLQFNAPTLSIKSMLINGSYSISELNITKKLIKTKFNNGLARGPTVITGTSNVVDLKTCTAKIRFSIVQIIDDKEQIVPQNLWDNCVNYYEYNENSDNNNDDDSKNDDIKKSQSSVVDMITEMNDKLTDKIDILIREVNELKRYIKKGNINVDTGNIGAAGNDDLLVFLKSINLDEYYNEFDQQGFKTNDDIKLITKDDLVLMNVNKIAHQKRILNAVKQYNDN